MLLKLISTMDRSRFDPSVVAMRGGGPLTADFHALKIPLHDLQMAGPKSFPAAWAQLRKLGRTLRPQVIQGWMYHGNLGASVMQRAAGNSSSLLWSIRVTADGRALSNRLTQWIIRWGAKNSKAPKSIIYNSERSATQHSEIGYCDRNTVIIPNGFDTEKFKPSTEQRATTRASLGLNLMAPVVGIVGRYNAIKDHKTFIEAAARVKAARPDTRFMMIGSGLDKDNEEIGRLISKANLGDSVHLMGMQTHTETLFPAMDVHVLSSVSEGFPNVLGEAMSCGIPCVATDAGDSAAIVADTGAIVPPRQPEALAQAIVKVLDEPPTVRDERGQAARQRIIDHFSLGSITHRFEDLYTKCALSDQPAASIAMNQTSMNDRRGTE